MQISQWTTEIIVISVIYCSRLLRDWLHFGQRRCATATGSVSSLANWGQAQQAQGLLTQQLAQAQEQLKAANNNVMGSRWRPARCRPSQRVPKSSCKSWRRN